MASEGALPAAERQGRDASSDCDASSEGALGGTGGTLALPDEGQAACGKAQQIAAYSYRRPGREARVQPQRETLEQRLQVFGRQRPPSESRPYDGMQHQALPLRGTPDPVMNSRWPNPSWVVGGPPLRGDTRRCLHNFGYAPSRTKSTFAALASQDPHPRAQTLTLTDVREGLTRHFGSLLIAFRHLDFFKDGLLSVLEWQDGVRTTFAKLPGEEGEAFRALCHPRDLYNRRMHAIFKSMDINADGLISYQEFSREFPDMVEAPHNFTMRRDKEKLQEMTGLVDAGDASPEARRSTLDAFARRHDLRLSSAALTLAGFDPESAGGVSASRGSGAKAAEGSEALRAFGTLLLERYPSVQVAFEAIDVNGNGQLSMAEFSEGCKQRVRFGGDAKAVFKELDTDGSGFIGIGEFRKLRGLRKVGSDVADKVRVRTKREITAARLRTDVADPAPHSRGLSLDDLQTIPLGPRVSTHAGFHTFARSSTGRNDKSLHPELMPGFDPESYSGERGPGHCARGPEAFAEIGCHEHPRRGTAWKSGATINRTGRFGPVIPSHQGRLDRELSAASYASYEGQLPRDTHSIHGGGAIGMWARVGRSGRPGYVDFVAGQLPRATARIGDPQTMSRMAGSRGSASAPSLAMAAR